MRASLLNLAKRIVMITGIVLLTIFGVRIYQTQRGLPLEPWHLYAPREMSAAELDAADWGAYLAAEQRIFDSLRDNVTQRLPPEEKVPFNRYFEDSPVYPARFRTDWNRSYSLEPEGAPAGVVVMLHGLTDSPYSLRHIAVQYQQRGFTVVAIRLPAHGTTPAALTRIEWPVWVAATRLAVREARRRVPAPAPLHIVGFSNGGTLALKYAFDSLLDDKLSTVEKIVLISPMVGVTRLARFAGLAGLPAILPPFAKAAWLSVIPEFNPFKYNSFPINGARQSYLLTDSLRETMATLERNGRLPALPPILTFQSVLDFTVSTPAVLSGLYDHLPANGSELVLFDINRSAKFGPLFRDAAEAKLSQLLPPQVRNYRLTILSNADPGSDHIVERMVDAGQEVERRRPLPIEYPKGVFSLSHVALPFPLDDSLYGLTPDGSEDYGVHLGALDLRGERGALIVSMEAFSRMSSNPFFPYLADRIGEGLPKARETAAGAPSPTKLENGKTDGEGGYFSDKLKRKLKPYKK
jgi:alpha-beta hydrolase superfamily lysophospholipase